ncbi:effector-associated constant component EACC1 [Micromonospora humida]|uniref:effector-associated constant component EACC1 n=1 Tax=Micromonospora humida TaxID=2809018 RepID=UPI0033D64505
MSHARIRIDFTPLADDDEFVLGELTEELADDLREVGEVERVERPVADPEAKGVAELALGVVTVLAGTDPGYVQALVDVVLAFLQRHTGRRVHLRVGDIELTIDRPTHGQTDELIATVRAAIERTRP